MAHHVSIHECQRMREMTDNGVSAREIAEECDRGEATVRRHVRHDCPHVDVTKDEILDALNELAEQLGRIPTTDEWMEWPDRPCAKNSVKVRFGSWRKALAAAGLPVVAPNAGQLVRTVAYQKPELTSSEVNI